MRDPDTNRETERRVINQHGQYTVHEIRKLDGVMPSFDAYDLVIRGHTMLVVGDTPETTRGALESLELLFDSPVAVDDIGIDLLRSRFVMMPLDGIQLLEDTTGKTYDDDRRVENPLTFSTPFQTSTVTIPHEPLQTEH